MTTRPFLTIGALALLLAGCGDDAVTGPSATPSVGGTWQGVMTAGAERPPMRMTIQQDGLELRGTWASEVPERGTGGSLGGTIDGAEINISLRGDNPATVCRLDVTATVNGSKMIGTYTTVACPLSAAGSLDLSRQ